LVQPNIAYSADGEFSAEEAVRELTALQEQSRRLQQLGADLVVWSEGSYPVTLPRDITADFTEDSPAMIRRGISIPLVIGASTYDTAR
jgi:apolipoprotein N-acyltransferase